MLTAYAFLQDRERLHAEVAEERRLLQKNLSSKTKATPNPNPNPTPNQERRLLQKNLSSKTEAVRLEADARVNALTQPPL